MSGTEFSHIFILESLGAGEIHTGKRLSEDLQDHVTIHEHSLVVEYHLLASKTTFIQLLGRIGEDAQEKGISPLLHFEMHGSQDSTGLILSSEEYVGWDELKEPLTRINVQSGLRLLVGLAACHGGRLFEISKPMDRAPFWGMIGPKYSLPGDRIHIDFTKFYTEWLKSGSGNLALRAVNSVDSEDSQYLFATAEWLFEEVCRRYLGEHCTDQAYEKRASDFYWRNIHKMPPGEKPKDVQRKLKSYERTSIEKYINNYFMFDLYPANRARFDVTYEQLKALTSA